MVFVRSLRLDEVMRGSPYDDVSIFIRRESHELALLCLTKYCGLSV